MNRSRELLRGLALGITLERNQGLDIEARHILPSGWALAYRDDGYLFTGPWSEQWDDIVWGLVRFLSYKSMVALSRSGAGVGSEFQLVSCMADGTGFRAVFRSSSSDRDEATI